MALEGSVAEGASLMCCCGALLACRTPQRRHSREGEWRAVVSISPSCFRRVGNPSPLGSTGWCARSSSAEGHGLCHCGGDAVGLASSTLCAKQRTRSEKRGGTRSSFLNNSEGCSPVASAGPLTVHNHVAGHIGWRACLSLSACEAVEVSVCRRFPELGKLCVSQSR